MAFLSHFKEDAMRSISEEFQNELQNGVLKWITDAVKDRDQNLILCFRDGYVNVYYKSHSLFKITQHRKRYKLSFNLRHARYTHTMETARSRLKQILPEIEFTKSDEVYFYADQIPQEAQIQILDKYKGYVDDFFDPVKIIDYIHPSRKRDLLEKVRQQELFTAHFEPCGVGEELVFYDIELSLPGKNSNHGSPDCLAVKLHNGIVTEIVLAEVKSTTGACMGNHGIAQHYEDFTTILKSSEALEFLYTSMVESLNHYRSLGFLSAVKCICSKENCRFSIQFFFTDAATKWTENIRQKNDNYFVFDTLRTENSMQPLTVKTDFEVRVLPVKM